MSRTAVKTPRETDRRPTAPVGAVVRGGVKPGLATEGLSVVVVVFLIGLVIPFVFQLGPLRLSVYRIVLLLAFLPLIVIWLMGRAGRIRLPDAALLVASLWIVLSYGVLHGASVAVETGGIILVETMGAYLIGRLFIRSPDDLYRVVRLMFFIVLALLPLALAEAVVNKGVALEIFGILHRSFNILEMDPRWGLRRVQSVFEHPILFGVFCSSILALSWFILGYGCSLVRRVTQSALVFFAATLSLSSGPMTAMGAQLALMIWDKVLRGMRTRWYALGGAFLSVVIMIEIFTNRSAIQILISYVAFRKESAWNRLRIWDYGTASVSNHPLFGIGRNEWERARFMPASIDMFWLVPAVKNGILPALMLQVAFFSVFFAVMFRKGLSLRDADYRTGYLIALLGLYLAGWTVHYWNSVYVLLMFLLGAGSCFLQTSSSTVSPPRPVSMPAKAATSVVGSLPDTSLVLPESARSSRYTRQTRRHFRSDAAKEKEDTG